MWKRPLVWIAVGLMTAAMIVVANDHLYNRRPSTVPSDAVFLRDRGKDVWIACEGRGPRNVFLCRFYAPRSGELLSALKYTLINESSPFTERVKIVGHSGYESIETTDGTLVVYHPMDF